MAEDFLTFLVDETFKLQQNGEAELSSLERKITDYHLCYLKGAFIPQTQMLRFDTHMGWLDIPINWSIFSMESGAVDTVLKAEDDHDHFFEIMQKAWNQELKSMLVTHADGFCYLVGFKAGEEHRLQDIQTPQEWLKAG